jgi:hypothetical protein
MAAARPDSVRAALNVSVLVAGAVALAALLVVAWSEVGDREYSLRVAVAALMALLVLVAMRRGIEELE